MILSVGSSLAKIMSMIHDYQAILYALKEPILDQMDHETKGSWRLVSNSMCRAVNENSNSLTWSGEASFEEELPVALMQSCPNVTQLICVGMTWLHDIRGLPPRLRVLNLSGSQVFGQGAVETPDGAEASEARQRDGAEDEEAGQHGLVLEQHAPSSPSPLEVCGSLERLDLTFTPCKTLSFISACSSLQHLNLSNCYNLSDLTELSSCRFLTDLDLSVCCVSDLSPLSTLTKLIHLDLSRCFNIINISSLSTLAKLQQLNLSRCYNVHDSLDSLSACTALMDLDLSYCPVSNLSALATCKDLQHLDLRGCRCILDLSFLAGLTGLVSLDLSKSEGPVDVSALAQCSLLKQILVFGCAPVTGIPALPENLRIAVSHEYYCGDTESDDVEDGAENEDWDEEESLDFSEKDLPDDVEWDDGDMYGDWEDDVQDHEF